ncbi:polysaccharide deacetylase family sporulation protein PdaB [Gorillibacterium massiliense]|uniref:polysaccharide deacetylase family sporulation protein PdaB n=1 Tax=Gorillibacterium massiliense TaxID=1280390 RepID=UPI0004B20054|nr:polysaccharide deacetylase family sporulation protein PdaB [Gorillibacterium massiliense]
MNSFYVFNGKKLKQLFIVMVTLVFAAGIIYSEKENLSVFDQKEPAAVFNVKTDKKMIALTFDISWGEKRPEQIADVLKKKGVADATFFLSSAWSESHPKVVEKLVKDGFEIGSHGHKHENYSKLKPNEVREQIVTAHRILTDLTKKAPTLIRLPNGDFNKEVLQTANELGYSVIQWDTDSHDWENPGVDTIVNRVLSGAHPGDIVLLHASDTCQQTDEALPIIIDKLRAQGYDFVSVSELLNQAHVQQREVQDQ